MKRIDVHSYGHVLENMMKVYNMNMMDKIGNLLLSKLEMNLVI